MKKKIITIAVVFSSLALHIYYLQLRNQMDVINCFSLNSSNYKEEYICVVLNKTIVIENKKEIAESIRQYIFFIFL